MQRQSLFFFVWNKRLRGQFCFSRLGEAGGAGGGTAISNLRCPRPTLHLADAAFEGGPGTAHGDSCFQNLSEVLGLCFLFSLLRIT